MGSFEKLGVLVIVVIIVMILAVAIYQWGGAGTEAVAGEYGHAYGTGTGAPHLEVDYIERDKKKRVDDADSWAGGVPRRHVVLKHDMLWKLVVQRWSLNRSFIDAIEAANPRINVRKLQPGSTLVIPNPDAYRSRGPRKKQEAGTLTRRYEIQIGDNLERIARKHLGRRSRWREILAVNPGLNTRRLMPGQVIRIPIK